MNEYLSAVNFARVVEMGAQERDLYVSRKRQTVNSRGQFEERKEFWFLRLTCCLSLWQNHKECGNVLQSIL